ncbi:alpha/beta hydrolase [Pseudomonadota bacterium]
MHTELISITTNTVPLEGAFYQPEDGTARGAVMLLHGNCMNFYVGAPRFLPPALTKLGFACLAFNRRGHDVLSTRDSRELEGGAYQTIDEAVADNCYAAEWLEQRGYDAPIVIGHSNGGMLAVQHVADHPDTPALVLLSAHRGGAKIVETMCENGLWAGDRLNEIRERAVDLVEKGQHRELLTLPGWWRIVGAQSALDFMSNVPGILELAPKINCSVLYLRGDEEPGDLYPAEAFSELCAGDCKVEIVENCGHFYTNRENEVIDRVSTWLSGN